MAREQLQKLVHSEGMTLEDAAEVIGLTLEEAKYAMASKGDANRTAQQLLRENEPKVVQMLIDICESSENDSARVAAGKALLGHLDSGSNFDEDRFKEFFNKASDAVKRARERGAQQERQASGKNGASHKGKDEGPVIEVQV